MTKMRINGSETGIVRLFQLDLPREAVARFTAQAGTGEWPLQYSLGARRLRNGFVDVVDIRDLGDMSLSKYLASAHSVAASEIKPMRSRIDALTGHVVILPSQAFDHVSQELTIATPLRWIGTFGEVAPAPKGPKLRSASASGMTGGRPAAPDSGNSGLLKLVLAGLAVLLLLLLVPTLL